MKVIRVTNYKDGLMVCYEVEHTWTTPVRERDSVKHQKFLFFKINDCSERNKAYKLLVP